MQKAMWVLVLLSGTATVAAQRVKAIRNKFADSSLAAQESVAGELPVITLSENDRPGNENVFVPGMLSAGRDVFASFASSHFSALHFRPRGYEASLTHAAVNGMPMNNADDGIPLWNAWGGLNEVTSNTQAVLFSDAGQQDFGGRGGFQYVDMRASKQRTGTMTGYGFSNGSFTHRWSFTRTSGPNRKAWTFALSANYRMADESYITGSVYSGGGCYFAADKKLGEKQVLSFVVFANAVLNGKQGAVLEESVQLAHSARYNPDWGYHSGKKRNANMAGTFLPVLLCTDEYRVTDRTRITATVGVQAGEKTGTGLDWYNAPDPRPDYYRYLPSYQTDSSIALQVGQALKADPSMQQIRWNRLYEVNSHSRETAASAQGFINDLRSHYILEKSVAALQRLAGSLVVTGKFYEAVSFAAGANFSLQRTRYYKKIDDLLGGEYFVDWNQFAENDFRSNSDAARNDLNRPDDIVRKGEVYGYDYIVHSRNINTWAQMEMQGRRSDWFGAIEIGYTGFQREGRMRTGLFPFNSFGLSTMNEFLHVAIKAGGVRKFSGRKYMYVHANLALEPPLFNNVFISPRTRDTRQSDIRQQRILSFETGYRVNAPAIRIRLSTYLALFTDGMDVLTFYHDGYHNFVNYALSGINKTHYGCELAGEWKPGRFVWGFAAAAGRYYYSSRQQAAVSIDNDAYVVERTTVYARNFRVGGMPQEAYGTSLRYQSPDGWYASVSVECSRQYWLDFNPMRRTEAALDQVAKNSDRWNNILRQPLLPDEYLVDASTGHSLRIRLFHAKHRQTMGLYARINNLLNQTKINGGYEQLRFDIDTKDPNKFPPKYFYGMGLNCSAGISLHL